MPREIYYKMLSLKNILLHYKNLALVLRHEKKQGTEQNRKRNAHHLWVLRTKNNYLHDLRKSMAACPLHPAKMQLKSEKWHNYVLLYCWADNNGVDVCSEKQEKTTKKGKKYATKSQVKEIKVRKGGKNLKIQTHTYSVFWTTHWSYVQKVLRVKL